MRQCPFESTRSGVIEIRSWGEDNDDDSNF